MQFEIIIVLMAILILLFPFTLRDLQAMDEENLEERSRRLHDEAIVIDTHSDTTLKMLDSGWNFMDRHDGGHVDYPRIREGGLDALFLAVYMGKQKEEEPGIAVSKAMQQFDCIRSLPEQYPEELELALTAADVRRIADKGKTALLIGVEGGHIIENRLDVLRCYFRLGARYMTLTHTFHHDWADSAGFGQKLPPRNGGLSDFGREVIQEMNRLGMMVDISHVSDETFWDVIDESRAPLIASHSGARALCDHVRNLSDKMIEALAKQGGVVQVVFFPGFLDPDYPKKKEKADKARAPQEKKIRMKYKDDPRKMRACLMKLRDEVPMEGTPLSILIDHIDHIIDRVGPDHVGLGADWDGIPMVVGDLEDCSNLPKITGELLRRGHSEEVIIKILGGNLLRVMEEVERIAE